MLRRIIPRKFNRFFATPQNMRVIHEGSAFYGPYVATVDSALTGKLTHLSAPHGNQGFLQTYDLSGRHTEVLRALHECERDKRQVFFYTSHEPSQVGETVHWDSAHLPNRQLPIHAVVITDGTTLSTPNPTLVPHFSQWLGEVIAQAPKHTKSFLEEMASKIKSMAESSHQPKGPSNPGST